MTILRWVLFMPLAFAVQAIVVLVLGLVFSFVGINNQIFSDSLSAFVGSFLLVFLAGYFAPAKRIKTSEVVFLVIVSLDILNLIANLFGLYSYVGLDTPNKLIPVLGILASLYAVTIFPSFAIQESTIDRLMGRIAGLGGITIGIGITTLVLGIIVKIITTNKETIFIASVVLVIGIITWAYPFVRLMLWKRRAQKYISEMKLNKQH